MTCMLKLNGCRLQRLFGGLSLVTGSHRTLLPRDVVHFPDPAPP